MEKALALANRHYDAREFREAENVYQQILRQRPDQPRALHMLGLIAHQVGKNEIAAELITRAISLEPDNFDAHNNLGIVHERLGNTLEAVSRFQKAISINPDHFHAFNNLGIQQFKEGNISDAINSYNGALSVNSDFQEAYLNRGAAYRKLGKPEDAESDYRKAISISPDNEAAHIDLAGTLRSLGKLHDSVASYRAALDLKPDRYDVHNDLGNTLRDLGELTAAIDCYRQATAIKPDYSMGHYNEGSVLKELGRFEEAVGCLQKSDLAISRAVLLECLYALRDEERFRHQLSSIIQEDPTNVGIAAISAFAANQFNRDDPYPFCNDPLEFISIKNLSSTSGSHSVLLRNVQKKIRELKLGGGNQSLLTSGFQSTGNLFLHENEAIGELENLIKKNISVYVSERTHSSCLLIQSWPEKYSLNGWYILMKQGGHLKWHNHTGGWLSGAVYLKMPTTDIDEGYIQFRLHGDDLPIFKQDYPEETRQISEGDLALFPSSLFHRTIPFQTDEERLCIAFDIVPN